MCVAYCALNKETMKNRYPIPDINELYGVFLFSKPDPCSRYHQIRIHPAYKPKTAFQIHEGHYEFWIMPFGFYQCSFYLSRVNE